MNKLIFSKFKAIVGGNLNILLSGGAPLAPDAHDFVRTCLGITLLQGYGLTETAATACIPDGSDLSTGRVGAPLQEVSRLSVTPDTFLILIGNFPMENSLQFFI